MQAEHIFTMGQFKHKGSPGKSFQASWQARLLINHAEPTMAVQAKGSRCPCPSLELGHGTEGSSAHGRGCL